MRDVNPVDGLPEDLEAELADLRARERLEEAEDREEYKHLYAGDWMTTSEAVRTLTERGSSSESAAGALIRWLQTNDGQRPNLRARADQFKRHWLGPRHRNPELRTDWMVHGFEWEAELIFSDWGSGTFELLEREEDAGDYRSSLTVLGVRLSRDDFNRRLSPGIAVAESADPTPALPAKRLNENGSEWKMWVESYKREHPVLPDVSREIFPAAKAIFGHRVTQKMVRAAFHGQRPGPRNYS